MTPRPVVTVITLLASLAGCSSSATSQTPSSSSSAAVATSTTEPVSATVHWRMSAVPGVPEQHCGSSHPEQCVLLGTETGILEGDLRGTSFTGTAAAFDKRGGFRFATGRADVFRGTVKGCGSGTLVVLGTELGDTNDGTGEWRIAEGFGTHDLAHVTGHGTGYGTINAQGFRSEWEGVIDCGK